MLSIYEDRQGHVVDYHGVQPTNFVVDEELFAVGTTSSCTQFLTNK